MLQITMRVVFTAACNLTFSSSPSTPGVIRKWLLCYFVPHADVWFFDVSWWTRRPIRDREGAFLRKGIYPGEKGIPGCW